MFDWFPTLKKFLWCIDLRIGALIVGILESIGYLADFVTTFMMVAKEEENMKELDLVLLYLERVFHLYGVFMAICLICGAWMVSKKNVMKINNNFFPPIS